MSKMVERVARAQERARNPQWTDELFEVWWGKDPFFCDQVTSWGYFTGTRKQHCLFEARAAIEAMRVPDVEMLAAFWRQKNNGTQEIGESGDKRSDYDAWRAAMSRALNEEG